MSRFPALFLLAVVSLGPPPAAAQCAMCREAAASHREETAAAFNRAIAALGIPPALILFGVGRAVWRRRKSPN